ncbi:endonuclease/exonuclease/phosphatase family metal-dependent hydrolase [Rhodoligotrophos appendicifer]|uniref:endonuclease/exonuclease/phosphatase family protein n=1 Tax=Rhodoligotrophos appendicifer TaxID=987056 RepID=UPI0011804A7F|nr:endonuclease/exonuclease/phosphatase family protein [Rhodoligotrophos appendicifer]
MTWNIHGAVGFDRRYDLDRIIELIQRHDPDIVALQEVDGRRRGRNNVPHVLLQEALGNHAAEARTITAPDGHYGHVLISRWPMQDIECHDISVGKREPRCALSVRVQTPGKPIHVVAVHLGLRTSERRSQAQRLAEIVGTGTETTVALGDFNDFRGIVRRTLSPLLPTFTKTRTFPSIYPIMPLDRIYVRPESAMSKYFTDTSAWYASDHLPLIADILY